MNRIIKFRAWDKREGKMWTPIIDKDGTPCATHPLNGILQRMDGDLLDPIMQFTGLLDKNGREIYEGDIVKIIDQFSRIIGVVQYADDMALYEIKSGQGSRAIYGFAQYNKNGPAEFTFPFKVIGNIYENPELLNNA